MGISAKFKVCMVLSGGSVLSLKCGFCCPSVHGMLCWGDLHTTMSPFGCTVWFAAGVRGGAARPVSFMSCTTQVLCACLFVFAAGVRGSATQPCMGCQGGAYWCPAYEAAHAAPQGIRACGASFHYMFVCGHCFLVPFLARGPLQAQRQLLTSRLQSC